MTDPFVIPLPFAKPPLAQNERRIWQQQHRDFQAAKEQARWAIRAAKVTPVERAEVTLHYRVPDMRRRDADGPAPTMKVCLDALVDEGVLRDDSFVYIPRTSIEIHAPIKGEPPAMWLSIEPLGPASVGPDSFQEEA